MYGRKTKYEQPSTDTSKGGFRRIVEGNYEIMSYLPDSSIRIWHNQASQSYSSHWHPAMEIITPLKNGYTVKVQQTRFDLLPGDILIIPSGELHELIAPATGERLIYVFDFSLISKIKGFSSLLPFWTQPILIQRDVSPTLFEEEYRLILQIHEEYFGEDSLREPIIYSLLIHFFVNLGRNHIQTDLSLSNSHPDKRRDLIARLNTVFDYLDKHYMEDLSLDAVSQIAGFSKFHFSRIFKECSGQNFYDYLSYKRIKSAETLLLRPDSTITEIALQSGFSSISTFNRTFKKVKNCTPSEYRALCSKSMH